MKTLKIVVCCDNEKEVLCINVECKCLILCCNVKRGNSDVYMHVLVTILLLSQSVMT